MPAMRVNAAYHCKKAAAGLEVKVTLSDREIPPLVGKLDFSENKIDRETGTMRVRAVLPNPDEILTHPAFSIQLMCRDPCPIRVF